MLKVLQRNLTPRISRNMLAFLCVLSVFLVSAQGVEQEMTPSMLQLKEEHEGLMAEMKGFLLEKVKEARDQVDGQVELLKVSVDTATKQGLDSINHRYEQSRAQLRKLNAPKECLESADQQLQEAKKLHGGNFLKCANWTIAAKDVVGIGYAAGSLGTELLLSADDILNGMSKCWSWNPFSFVKCTFLWVKTAIEDVINTFHDISNFNKEVSALVNDIKAQVKYCVNQGKDDKVTEETIKSLQNLHQCAQNKGLPNH